jgi:hypothetical protein
MATKSRKPPARRSNKKARVAAAEPKPLGRWLRALENNAKDVAAAGGSVGACLVTDPHTGTESCVLTDQKTCKALSGTFIGGPCGP